MFQINDLYLMSKKTLHIKNMVCPRCISAVETTLKELNIPFNNVKLGIAEIEDAPAIDYEILEHKLQDIGFELIKDKSQQLVEHIKQIVIQQIYNEKTEGQKVNFSKFISDELDYDYSYLSNIFSTLEQLTIEKFIILQKIERVKELVSYNALSFSEIAFKVHYSSVSHLSKQFKSITGLTLSDYKKQEHKQRNSIEGIQ